MVRGFILTLGTSNRTGLRHPSPCKSHVRYWCFDHFRQKAFNKIMETKRRGLARRDYHMETTSRRRSDALCNTRIIQIIIIIIVIVIQIIIIITTWNARSTGFYIFPRRVFSVRVRGYEAPVSRPLPARKPNKRSRSLLSHNIMIITTQ